MSKLTRAQRARLEKLAAYLEGLPKNYRHFNMAVFAMNFDKNGGETAYARKNGGVSAYGCGTVACAVGHGPAAGILVPPRMARSYYVDWDAYSELFVGHDYKAFSWAFDGDWHSVDSTHYGAAARIRYLLDIGAVPDGFGQKPLRKHRAIYAPYRIDARHPTHAGDGQ